MTDMEVAAETIVVMTMAIVVEATVTKAAVEVATAMTGADLAGLNLMIVDLQETAVACLRPSAHGTAFQSLSRPSE